MELIVTPEHYRVVQEAGACTSALKQYPPGTCFSRIRVPDLIWVENHLPKEARYLAGILSQRVSLIGGVLPLWAFGYGYGYGYGCGYGHGFGDGDGYGSGVGFGDGVGYGVGDGYGLGDGLGDGHGDGYGYGSGVGYGLGDGLGDGVGDGDGYGNVGN